MAINVRSQLCAGLAVGVLATTATAVISAPAAAPLPMVSVPAVDLAAALQPLLNIAVGPDAPDRASVSADVGGVTASPGDWLISAYNTVQPWVAYGVELFAWAVEWLPWPIGLLAPQADIIYSGWQPFAESVVYSLAFLIDGQFDLVLPTLAYGIQTGVSTLIENEIAWVLSFFPPLPPIPVLEAAAAEPTTARTVSARGAQAAAAAAADPAPSAADTSASGATVESPASALPAPSGRATAQRAVVRSPRPTRADTPSPAAAVEETAARADASVGATTAADHRHEQRRAASLRAGR